MPTSTSTLVYMYKDKYKKIDTSVQLKYKQK